jgi:hypothetical protein
MASAGISRPTSSRSPPTGRASTSTPSGSRPTPRSTSSARRTARSSASPGLHRRIDAARLELLKATTDRKAVEVLRQRRYEAWRAEQARREAIALDEISTMRAGRMEDAA